jgi:hypothetical protein
MQIPRWIPVYGISHRRGVPKPFFDAVYSEGSDEVAIEVRHSSPGQYFFFLRYHLYLCAVHVHIHVHTHDDQSKPAKREEAKRNGPLLFPSRPSHEVGRSPISPSPLGLDIDHRHHAARASCLGTWIWAYVGFIIKLGA